MSDGPDYERDPATGMPWLPCQRALAYAEVTEDYSGEVLNEVLILPNMMIFFSHIRGTRIGDSILMSPQKARQLIDSALPERCAHVTKCDCESHAGRTMTQLNPEEAFRG